MGRSFASVRMGVKEITGRWERVARTLPGADREAALRVVSMAKRHASEGFYGFSDPLEAAVFSVLVELLKEQDRTPALPTGHKRDPARYRDPEPSAPAREEAGS
jgi:hypothetical protein